MTRKSAASVLNIKNQKMKILLKHAPINNNIKTRKKTSKQPTSTINLFVNLFPKDFELILQPYTAD